MRLWSLHPKHLDPQGLVALWREALLAQKVLAGKTKGYKNHSQLIRFKAQSSPRQYVSAYLKAVFEESKNRGYTFDGRKIQRANVKKKMIVTQGQLRYEFKWLMSKLRKRNPKFLKRNQNYKKPIAHPLFRVVSGPPESWEKV